MAFPFLCSSKGHGKVQEQELVVVGSVDCVLSSLLKLLNMRKVWKENYGINERMPGFDV